MYGIAGHDRSFLHETEIAHRAYGVGIVCRAYDRSYFSASSIAPNPTVASQAPSRRKKLALASLRRQLTFVREPVPPSALPPLSLARCSASNLASFSASRHAATVRMLELLKACCQERSANSSTGEVAGTEYIVSVVRIALTSQRMGSCLKDHVSYDA